MMNFGIAGAAGRAKGDSAVEQSEIAEGDPFEILMATSSREEGS